LVTHDQVEAMTMADTLAVMRDGRFVQVGRPDTVYRKPVDAWTAQFLGDAVLIPGTRSATNLVTSALGEATLATAFDHHDATDVVMFCRPEQLRPVTTGDGGVHAKVIAVRFQGPDAMV